MKIFNVQNIYAGYKYFEPDTEFTEYDILVHFVSDKCPEGGI